MVAKGPLLEYAGRDLALMQWAAAARHWLVLVLAAQIFLPRAGRLVAARAAARRPVVLCAAWRSPKTHTAKMRVLSSRACCRRARWSRCSASSHGSWRRRERDRPVGSSVSGSPW